MHLLRVASGRSLYVYTVHSVQYSRSILKPHRARIDNANRSHTENPYLQNYIDQIEGGRAERGQMLYIIYIHNALT
jgi:hypothetical protein